MNTSKESSVFLAAFVSMITPAVFCYAQGDRVAGYVVLHVPEGAVVFANDHRTQTTGLRRRYVSRLQPGRVYRFRFRVELQRGNQTLETTKMVSLRAGETANLIFSESQFAPRTMTRKPTLPEAEKPQLRSSEPKAADASNLPKLDDNAPSFPPRDNMKRTALPAAPTRPPAPPRPTIPSYSPPIVQQYLNQVQFSQAEDELKELLDKSPDDNELRFSLAATQFLHGVDELLNGLYRHGLQNKTEFFFGKIEIPFLRLPVPTNPAAEPIEYEQARGILQAFADRMQQAESTLAGMDASEFQLPVDIAPLGFDVDRDGRIDQKLWDVFQRVNPRARMTQTQDSKFVVFFDRSDAYWLQGYCHLLKAMVEVTLAYDFRELFHRSAHLFFAKAVTPYSFLQKENNSDSRFTDTIAMIHSVNLPVAEPTRMKRALEHLETTVALSRKMWASIQAESDDLREWIPGPQQTSVFRNLRVTQPILDSWLRFLDETEKVLAGAKLLPFWRSIAPDKGINLRRVFTEPTTFDLVEWQQGISATPYLETGEKTDQQVWRQLQRVLGGQLVSFAIWVN